MLDCTSRLMHWFWIVEPERASTTACVKAILKMRTLDSRQNPPLFAQAHASFPPHPFFLLFLKYNTCALLKGRVGDEIRPPAQSYVILEWVTGWSGPSVNHPSDLQMGRSLHGAQCTCLGCSWRSPLHTCIFFVIFCSCLPQPQNFCNLFVQNQPHRADQPSALGCLSVTWYSREVVLSYVLWGINWSSNIFLKNHGVSDPFLMSVSRMGNFMIKTDYWSKVTAQGMLKNSFMKENRHRTTNAISLVWQKHLWLNDCGFSRDMVGVTQDVMYRSHWISKEAKRTSWFKDNLKAWE